MSWMLPLFMATSTMTNAATSASAQRAQGAHRKSMSDANSRLAQMRSQEALMRGEADAKRVRRFGKKVKGQQRASAAAQGLDPDSGDAADLQTETELNTAVDERTARTNAYLEAWGLEMEAINASSEGRFAEMSANHSANMTVLSGGMQALGYGVSYKDKQDRRKKKQEEDLYGDDSEV